MAKTDNFNTFFFVVLILALTNNQKQVESTFALSTCFIFKNLIFYIMFLYGSVWDEFMLLAPHSPPLGSGSGFVFDSMASDISLSSSMVLITGVW